VLALAAGGGYFYWRTNAEKEANGHITVSGNLEMTQVDISFKASGKLMELTVREGDFVKKGQLIARIDRNQI